MCDMVSQVDGLVCVCVYAMILEILLLYTMMTQIQQYTAAAPFCTFLQSTDKRAKAEVESKV